MSEQTRKKAMQYLIVLGLLIANIIYLAYSPLFPS